MATIEDNRFTKWQAKELQRVSDLNTWYNTVSSALSSYIPLLKKTLEIEGEEGEQARSKRFYTLRNQLSYLPTDNLVELGALLKDKNALLKYAPHHLLMEITKPKTPVLGDEDVTNEISSYIVTNDLQKDIDPTTEELMNEIIRILKDIDKTSLDDTGLFYGKFIIDGFPSDPEYWGYLIKAGLLPDYTITIIENREIDADLLQHYINIGKYTKHHQERFLLSSDVLVKTKLLHDEPPENKYLDMQIIIDNLVLTLFDSESIDDVANKTEKSPDADAITGFTETMEKFREEWEVSKSKLEENYKCFVETEIEDKSDIDIIDEVLKKIRNCYFNPCVIIEEGLDIPDDDSEITKDVLTYNEPRFLGETNIYCPLAFYDYGVLWEGKSELATSYDNKTYCFSKEECVDIFQRDVKKYLCYNKPYKNDIPLRICVIGNIGSGKTTYSRLIAKELGLFHIDFKDFINKYLIPKHFKKVGWQYENRFTDAAVGEEEVVELQIDEENLNYISDITFNEQELRRIIYNYIEHGSPLLSPLLQPLLKKLWNEQPFNNRGVVIDGFPKLPTDVEDMISCFCIPEIVIEIESDSETSLNRISPKMFKQWKLQLAEAKLKAKNKLDREKQEWLHFVTKTVVIKLIIDDILGEAVNEEEPLKISSVESTIFDANPLGSANVDVNLFRTYNELIQEYPEPVDQNVWESADDVLEHINNRIESIFEIDDENIQVLKDMLLENKIKIVSVDGKKSKQKIQRKILSKLSNIRNRTPSFLEQTFIVNCDIAEMLLLEGFFLLSKFYRMCPVFISENPKTKFNPYSLNKRKNKVFPIIHRAYIYFISSEDNVKKFRRDPLKYINNDQIKSYKEHPLRIGIIGPPKSGKSTVAAKLAKRYGLMCMSKGMAIRHILENMDWTTLGFKMKKLLKEGKCIDNELIMTAVLTASIDHRTMTNGFVLDGFPETPFEICQLLKYGLYPLIIFDVKSDEKVILDSSQNEIYPDILKIKPPFSRPFIKKRHNGYPADKNGVVQYKNYFYWICPEHLDTVLESPEDFLNPVTIEIPEIPTVVTAINTALVYENGICIVTSGCLKMFLARPHFYYDIKVFKDTSVLPKLTLNKLPHLGYLEQTVASRVPVPDERYDYLCQYHKPLSKVPAFLNVVDIAGLVRGAAEGQGLGNAFLSHIKACDAIFNLCRAFDDENVIHVDGEVNPIRDLETIGEELRLKDEEQLMQNIEKLDRVVNRGGDKKLKPEYEALAKIKTILVEEKKHIRFGDWSAADIEVLNKYLFLTSKPALYLVNLSEKDYIRKKNKWLPKLKEWIDKNDPGAPLIPFSGALESKLLDMEPDEREKFLKENNITSALDKIIVQGYKSLQLEYFFTAGADEVKAWTIQKGTKAPQAAGRIHTDFEKGFIMAEVMHFKDFKEEGSESACKAAGKYRQQGRNYVVEDGDIIFFKFNAGAGLKDAKKK
ncbi:GTPase [Danaus plexippus plexippus]|uniref:GTPase n=1 Tax=Danaus plexippus plexippus TaxID=278856 RepID=A0A212EUR4_DANPL|nr:GTPase [Danaus plexippus plexippus]